MILLLARGRDRLETRVSAMGKPLILFSYSLGDAIDWKLDSHTSASTVRDFSYSLGDAIDWKQANACFNSCTLHSSPTR